MEAADRFPPLFFIRRSPTLTRTSARHRDELQNRQYEENAEAVNRPALPLSWGGFTCGSAGGPRHIQPFAQYAGRMAGTNAGGRGAGTSAARFRILPLTQLPRIWWGSAQHICYVGPMAVPSGGRTTPACTSPRIHPDATPGLRTGNEVLGDLDCRPPATLS